MEGGFGRAEERRYPYVYIYGRGWRWEDPIFFYTYFQIPMQCKWDRNDFAINHLFILKNHVLKKYYCIYNTYKITCKLKFKFNNII